MMYALVPSAEVEDLLDDLVGRLRADLPAERADRVARAQTGCGGSPWISVTVPTVERGLLLVVFCSMLTAGERPLIRWTFGFWSGAEVGRNTRGFRQRLCPSA